MDERLKQVKGRWNETGYDSLRSELANQFGVKELTYLASGDDSDTFLYGDCYVVKVPKHENVVRMQKREFQLYSFLNKQKLSFQTPKVVYQGDCYNVMNYLSGQRITFIGIWRIHP